MTQSTPDLRSLKGQIKRTSIVLTAAAIMRRQGPSKVTYNSVARMARISSSLITYYFDSLDQLLKEAAEYNVNLLVKQAEESVRQAEQLGEEGSRKQIVSLLIRAYLPGEDFSMVGYSKQLLFADEVESLNEVFKKGRRKLKVLIGELLSEAGIAADVCAVTALVDGAVLQAISEGNDPRELAAEVLTRFIDNEVA